MMKFVPASGRASRMFHGLHALRGRGSPPSEKELLEAEACFKDISKFAFHAELQSAVRSAGLDLQELVAKRDYVQVADFLLGPRGSATASSPRPFCASTARARGRAPLSRSTSPKPRRTRATRRESAGSTLPSRRMPSRAFRIS